MKNQNPAAYQLAGVQEAIQFGRVAQRAHHRPLHIRIVQLQCERFNFHALEGNSARLQLVGNKCRAAPITARCT